MFLPFLGAVAVAQKPTPMFPVALEVPSAPTAFKANGKLNLVYELHATSFRAGDLLLTRVEVFNDDGNATPLASYSEADLKNLLARPGAGSQLADARLIAAGMRAVVYLWLTFDTPAGDHVVLDMGQGRYALYAHMQPGKMRVRVGDRVKRGQVLGLLGNSGNAVGPHLHFHIADSPVALGGEGLPFVFDSFEVLGVESPQAFKDGAWRPDPNFKVERRRMEMPIDSVVVRFP